MNDALEAVGATPAPAATPTKKVVAKKSTPIKKPAAKAAPAVSKTGRTTGNSGKSPAERRWAIVSAMKSLGATNALSAKTADEIAKKSGLTRFDVYGHLYHTRQLQVEGYAKQVSHEEVRGLSYHLTAKGAKAVKETFVG